MYPPDPGLNLGQRRVKPACYPLHHRGDDVPWNRFVNTKGKAGGNIPIDLFMEHCNRPLKLDDSTFRGEFTEKTLQRLSRCTNVTEAIVHQFDNETKTHKPSGKHTKVDTTDDILTLIKALHGKKVFQEILGR